MSEKRLLVVDDEPEFGELVSKVASDLGYQVRSSPTVALSNRHISNASLP